MAAQSAYCDIYSFVTIFHFTSTFAWKYTLRTEAFWRLIMKSATICVVCCELWIRVNFFLACSALWNKLLQYVTKLVRIAASAQKCKKSDTYAPWCRCQCVNKFTIEATCWARTTPRVQELGARKANFAFGSAGASFSCLLMMEFRY